MLMKADEKIFKSYDLKEEHIKNNYWCLLCLVSFLKLDDKLKTSDGGIKVIKLD